MFGHDQTYLERPCVRRRAMQVDTPDVGIVEFDADDGKRARTVDRGDRKAKAFLDDWNWEQFKADCPPIPAQGGEP